MVVDDLQRAFEQRVRDLTGAFSRGDLNLTDWHTKMAGSVRLYLTMQHLEGARGARVGFVPVNQEVRRQHAYLSRFADEIAIRQLQGQAMTEAQIANRASLYGGAGRAVNQRAVESLQPRGGGVMFEYISIDSPTTCSACLAAEGFYASGQGPMPGEVCFGRSRCRCRRIRIDQAQIPNRAAA